MFKEASHLQKERIDFVLVTVTGLRGSAPQEIGAKCIVTKNGLHSGTVGGGKIEAHIISHAKKLLSGVSKIETATWNLQKDIGMTCGGEMSFIFETFRSPSFKIAIFGAGHVSQALTRTLAHLECQITCMDDREEWTSKLDASQENLKIVHTKNYEEVEELDEDTFFISMTKGHASDVPILKRVSDLFPECQYVGVIGSDVKGKRIRAELKEQNVSKDFLDKLRVPIGLPIGNDNPYEIAISIIAELLQVRGNSSTP